MTISNNVEIKSKNGLHTRPAGMLCKITNKPEYSPIGIFIMFNGMRIDAKSILNVLALGATAGSNLILEIEGDDAEKDLMQEAMDELVHFFDSSFNNIDSDDEGEEESNAPADSADY